jgi:hypothetical protein
VNIFFSSNNLSIIQALCLTVLVFLVFAIFWLGHFLISVYASALMAYGIFEPLYLIIFNDNGLHCNFAVKYCDATEEYSPSELALIYYSELLPTESFLAFDLVVPVVAAASAGPTGSPRVVLSAPLSTDLSLCSLMDQAAYSVDAQDQLCPLLACLIHAKPAVYRRVVLNPKFPLAG